MAAEKSLGCPERGRGREAQRPAAAPNRFCETAERQSPMATDVGQRMRIHKRVNTRRHNWLVGKGCLKIVFVRNKYNHDAMKHAHFLIGKLRERGYSATSCYGVLRAVAQESGGGEQRRDIAQQRFFLKLPFSSSIRPAAVHRALRANRRLLEKALGRRATISVAWSTLPYLFLRRYPQSWKPRLR